MSYSPIDPPPVVQATYTPSGIAKEASWLKVILGYLLIAAPLVVVSFFAFPILLLGAGFLVLIAIPYTTVATIWILKRRKAARLELESGDPVYVENNIVNFGGLSQKLSLINGAVLGLVGIALVAQWAFPTLFSNFFTDSIGGSGTSTIFVLGAAAFFSLVEIGVNAQWIYSKNIIRSEEYALKTKTGQWQLILFNRWLGWVIWYTGAGIILVGIVYSGISSLLY